MANFLNNIKNKVANTVSKAGGIKGKIAGAVIKKMDAKSFIKLKIKITVICVLIVMVIVASLVQLIQNIFKQTNTAITATTNSYKTALENGTFEGDEDQINKALELYEQYGSFLGFTIDQINELSKSGYESIDSNKDAYDAYTSKYGTLKSNQKTDIENLYNDLIEENDYTNLLEKEIAYLDFYNYSKSGNLVAAISIDDNQYLYTHILNTEKYNFNNINWIAYTHSSSSSQKVSDSEFTYNSSLGLIYPTTGNLNINDLMDLVSPYLMSSSIPLSYLTSSIYTSNQSSDIGTSFAEVMLNEDQGKKNNIGDFAYQIVKYGQSDITINQYQLESRTTASYWLDYDTKLCKDTFSITQTEKEIKYYDRAGNEIRGNAQTEEVQTRYTSGTLVDGTNNPGEVTGHVNTRMNDETGAEDPSKEYLNGEPLYSTSVQYKLANALAFDVKINNSFEYEKYSDEDADKLINEDAVLSQETSPYSEVDESTKENKATEDILNSYNTMDEFESKYNVDMNSKTRVATPTSVRIDNPDGSYRIETTYTYSYDVTTKDYTLNQGTRYDITRQWSDTVSANPTSTSKTLLGLSDIINFNKNSENDYNKSTVSEQDFKSDTDSKSYYENDIINKEGTALNTVDILNSNPKIFNSYLASYQAKGTYIGYKRGDFEIAQAINELKTQFRSFADENNTLPFVYGASLGFEVNASPATGLSGRGRNALLKEFIHAWETGGKEPLSNGDKYIVYDDGAGHPTVGYGIDIYNSGFLQNFLDAGYDVSIGAEIDKDFVDKLEDIAIDNKRKVVEANTQGLNLTDYQMDALVCRAYNWWSNSFRDVYLQYWNQERDDKFGGEPDYSHGLYTNHMNKPITSNGQVLNGLIARRESEWRLFQTGHYYRAGIMDKWWSPSAGGDILEGAEAVHKVMEDERWTYSIGGDLYWNNIEMSLNNPNKVTCCATFVGASLYYAGIFTEDEMNSFNYNACNPSFAYYSQHGSVITSYDELEAGDIVFFDYQSDGDLDHVEIYAGDNTWYGAGATESIQRDSPYKDSTFWRSVFAKAVRLDI